jgi:lysozyme
MACADRIACAGIPDRAGAVIEKLRQQLIRDEGNIPHAYQDSLGYWTIGVGHLIDKRKGGALPQDIIEALLDRDIEQHSRELFDALPWVKELDQVRIAVLVNMAFNLGIKGLLGFANTLSSIKARDFSGAAAKMLQSKWASQVGIRATRLAEQMRTGEWQ